ncbi:hypothetical protein RCL1_001193 [Eukaryota sp. TZLM3-RCL]
MKGIGLFILYIRQYFGFSLLKGSHDFGPEWTLDKILYLITLIALSTYLIIYIALICEHYFMESVLIMSDKLRLAADVAGGTLIAIGSSLPELFASFVGLYVQKSDVGLSGCLGAAVFNVFVSFGTAALFVGKVSLLDWRVVLRDCFFFTCSICVVVWSLWDSQITRIEATVLLGTYILYVLALMFSKKYFEFLEWFFLRGKRHSLKSLKTTPTLGQKAVPDLMDPAESDNHHNVPFYRPPRSLLKFFIWFILFPIKFVQTCTMTPCHTPKTKKFYIITFALSILHIGIVEYFVVEFIAEVGSLLGLSSEVTGLILLAPASCAAEVVTSVIAMKKGMTNTVISNVVGSNVFDLLLALGLPWFSWVVIYPREDLFFENANLILDGVILIAVVLILLVSIVLSRFRIRKVLGVVFLLFYAGYVVFDVMYLAE